MPSRPQKPQRRPGKTSKRHQALRAQVIAEETWCGVCGKEVDKGLPGTNPWGATSGHIKSVRRFPELEFDRNNLELQHNICNGQQGS